MKKPNLRERLRAKKVPREDIVLGRGRGRHALPARADSEMGHTGPHPMRLSLVHKLVSAGAIVVLAGLGAWGAYVAVLIEQDVQMHGVEPGPEATRALVVEGASGFLLGVLAGAVLLIALAVVGRYFWKGRSA